MFISSQMKSDIYTSQQEVGGETFTQVYLGYPGLSVLICVYPGLPVFIEVYHGLSVFTQVNQPAGGWW